MNTITFNDAVDARRRFVRFQSPSCSLDPEWSHYWAKVVFREETVLVICTQCGREPMEVLMERAFT
jgi:hypothetical protein